MVCSVCHREKMQMKVKPKREWAGLSASLQLAAGIGLLWFGAWVLGRVLLSIPSEFHEGTTWDRFRF